MRIWLCFVLFVLTSNSLFSQASYFLDFNAACKKIYNDYTSLQFSAARQGVSLEMKNNPYNIMPIVLADYGDFFDLFFNEDIQKYQANKNNQQKRLNSIELCKDQNAYYLLSKAQVYFHWSLIKIKYKDYFSSVFDLRRSYLLFKECKQKYPDFKTPDVYIGTIESIAGTIPDSYKWVSNMMGIRANLLQGSSMLAAYASNENNLFFTDAIFLDTYVKQYLLSREDLAWKNIQRCEKYLSKNKLLSFMAANIALNQKKAKQCIQFIEQLNDKLSFLEMPVVHYELGTANLFLLKFNEAEQELLKYTNTFKGKFYIKDSYYKLYWIAYLRNDQVKAQQYLKHIASDGNTESDADKRAADFAKTPEAVNKQLLKARFLFDGGSDDEALQILNALNVNTLRSNAEILEYNYRKAVIYRNQKSIEMATTYFLYTIEKGKFSKTYFGSKSSLYLAQMYEEQKQFVKAKEYYTLCLSMKNHEYKSSIDQMAKSGLLRINKK